MVVRAVGALLIGAALAWLIHAITTSAMEAKEEVDERVERKKAFAERIESMLPKDRGLAPTPTFPEDFLKVKIKVFRRDMRDPAKAYTLIKIDNDRETFELPRGWKGRSRETKARIAAYDEVVAKVKTAVDRKMRAHGGAPEEVKGEIVAPPPSGGAVPHGDIFSMLNVFLSLGMIDVVFEGAATPLTAAERAALEDEPAKPLVIRLELEADGMLVIDDQRLDLAGAETQAQQDALRRAVRTELKKRGIALPHDPKLDPPTSVEVVSAHEAPWLHVQRLIKLLNHDEILLTQVKFRTLPAKAAAPAGNGEDDDPKKR